MNPPQEENTNETMLSEACLNIKSETKVDDAPRESYHFDFEKIDKIGLTTETILPQQELSTELNCQHLLSKSTDSKKIDLLLSLCDTGSGTEERKREDTNKSHCLTTLGNLDLEEAEPINERHNLTVFHTSENLVGLKEVRTKKTEVGKSETSGFTFTQAANKDNADGFLRPWNQCNQSNDNKELELDLTLKRSNIKMDKSANFVESNSATSYPHAKQPLHWTFYNNFNVKNKIGSNAFRLSTGTSFEVRASHLLKIVCVLIVFTGLVATLLHSRVRTLEAQKVGLQEELSEVKLHLQRLSDRMNTVANLAIPPRSQSGWNNENSGSREEHKEVQERKRSLVKRSASNSRSTKELQFASEQFGLNELNNETTASSTFDAMTGSWRDGVVTSSYSHTQSTSRSFKGNGRKTDCGKQSRRFRKELRHIKIAHRSQIRNIKQKLKQLQTHPFSKNISSCCNENSSLFNFSQPTAFSTSQQKYTRAAYFQIDGTSVNIKKSRQLIGPWYLPENGNEIGFNDLWYKNLELDLNATSIIFQEDGLFLIYAQVFYQLQHVLNSNPNPMGYRIHLKKNANKSQYKRPLTIAECVPSFPSTFYQTCFTQVAWYVEAKDEIYLEHFTESLPMIEALRSGQTFLGLVRL